MNAKEELLRKIADIQKFMEGTQLRCATISHEPFGYWLDDDYKPKPIELKLGYTPSELKEFLNSLDFDYDNGYGSQQLFGTVWFTNGIWMDRYEYDGSEHWDIHKYPGIPIELCTVHIID